MGELSWVGQLANLTASGAVISMFAWMLYQMPKYLAEERSSREKIAEMERSSREKIAEQERRSREMVAAKNEANVVAILTEAREQVKYERESCERRHDELIKRIEALHLLERETKHEVVNIAQSEANRRALEELQRKSPTSGGKP